MKANTIKKIAALALSAAVAISAVPTTTAFAADTAQATVDDANTTDPIYYVGEVTGGALTITGGDPIEVTTAGSISLAISGGAISATTDTAITFTGDNDYDLTFEFDKDQNVSVPMEFTAEHNGTYTFDKVTGIDEDDYNVDGELKIVVNIPNGDSNKDDGNKPSTDPILPPSDNTGSAITPGGDSGSGSGSGSGTTTPTTPATPDDGKNDTTSAEPAPAGTTLKDSSKNTYKVTAGKKVQYTGTKSKAATVKVPATVTINGVTYKVTSIKAGAFKGNKTAKTITVGNNVTTIGKNAFANCTKLTTVKLGNKVTKIGAKAFAGCKNLKVITINSKKLTNSSLSNNAFKGISKNVTIKVPKSKVAAYKKLFVKNGLNKNVKIKAI